MAKTTKVLIDRELLSAINAAPKTTLRELYHKTGLTQHDCGIELGYPNGSGLCKVVKGLQSPSEDLILRVYNRFGYHLVRENTRENLLDAELTECKAQLKMYEHTHKVVRRTMQEHLYRLYKHKDYLEDMIHHIDLEIDILESKLKGGDK